MAFSVPAKRMFIPGEQLGIVDEAMVRREKYGRFIDRQVEQAFATAKVTQEVKRLVNKRLHEEVERIVALEAAKKVAEIKMSHFPLGPPVAHILKAAAEATGYSVGELIGPCRNQRMAAARHLAMHMLRTLRPDLSSTAIGVVMHKDHSTVLHGLKVYLSRRGREPTLSWLAHPALQSLVEGGHD